MAHHLAHLTIRHGDSQHGIEEVEYLREVLGGGLFLVVFQLDQDT
jgi:hypothetical protein